MKKLLNKWWRVKADAIEDAAVNHDTRELFDGLKTIGAVYDKKSQTRISNPKMERNHSPQKKNANKDGKNTTMHN